MLPTKNIEQNQQRIIDEMASLGDGLAKYRYLIDQGGLLDTRGGSLRREENLIPGCQSSVWMVLHCPEERMRIHADSDAKIVLGIAALLVRVFDDQPVEEVAAARVHFIERTGLSAHLSPHRANGLATMLDYIRTQAIALSRDG